MRELTESVAPSFVKVSLDETNRMMRMITDLLSLSRIDNQVGQIDVELINFTAFVTFILNRFDQMKMLIQIRSIRLFVTIKSVLFGLRLIQIR